MADYANNLFTDTQPLEIVKNNPIKLPAISKKGGIIGMTGPFTRQKLPSSRTDWLRLRKIGLGGSDAGKVMDSTKYGSPLTVYGDKLDLIPDETDDMEKAKPWLRRGRVMEPVVIKEFKIDFKKEDGRDLQATRYPYFLKSKEHDFMTANIDGLVNIEGMGIGLLEVKTASRFANSVKEWEDNGIPDSYYWQCIHYLAVTGLPYALIVVWIDGEIQWRFIPRNDQRIKQLVEMEKHVWQMIQDKTPPAPCGLDSEDLIVRALAGEITDGVSELDNEYAPLFDELAEIKIQLADMERREKELKQRLRLTLVGVKKCTLEKHYVSVTNVTSNRFDVGAFKIFDPELHAKFMKTSSYERLNIK